MTWRWGRLNDDVVQDKNKWRLRLHPLSDNGYRGRRLVLLQFYRRYIPPSGATFILTSSRCHVATAPLVSFCQPCVSLPLLCVPASAQRHSPFGICVCTGDHRAVHPGLADVQTLPGSETGHMRYTDIRYTLHPLRLYYSSPPFGFITKETYNDILAHNILIVWYCNHIYTCCYIIFTCTWFLCDYFNGQR